ncbi:MAG: hypothetical protein EP330_31310 [Deltaproteobacteria bacterium]|nr:MAG: hypothetical protein EP330_31310 [Deltaproteobacteria bacterium]
MWRVLGVMLVVGCGGNEVISLETRDGLTLYADRYPGEDGRAAVLLHMTPDCCDRTDWPAAFIENLGAEGYTVIVPDRRGAGDSEGLGEDAYLGDAGRYDVEAAVNAVDATTELLLVGASNGTTSMLDYTAWAPEEGLREPTGLAFLTGGAYTENQTPMGTWLAGTPAVFAYSTDERAWSVEQLALDAGAWQFIEEPEGAHGTRMFDAVPGFAAELVDAISR